VDDLKLVPPFLVALLVPAVVLNTLIQRAFYPDATVAPQIAAVHVPLWANLYGAFVWPLLWCFTEEVTYLGYLFPRLEVIIGSTARAAVVVLLMWAMQHPALPLLGGVYPVYRALTALVTVLPQTLLFTWKRRLLPLIVTHTLADIGAGVAALLAA
jgi:membrane protease YdiL (CAAX protease family)